VFHLRIDDEARHSDAFRAVLHTGARCQVVIMTLQPGEDIGAALHGDTEEILVVVEGHGEVTVAGATDEVGAGSLVVVPQAAERNLLNTGDVPLRLYAVYAPPEHADSTRHETRADDVGVDQAPPPPDLGDVLRFDVTDAAQRAEGLAAARDALRRGALVVLPTDTVHGLAANAFDPDAVADLRRLQGRDESAALPILVDSVERLDELVSELPPPTRLLVEAFWPGALTVICTAHPSLPEHLSDARGHVTVRMPQHTIALDLLAAGPLVVTGANRVVKGVSSGIDTAIAGLGAAVEVYLDDGTRDGPMPSTIIDGTGQRPLLLRAGAVPRGALIEVAGELESAP
jgi:tRNA threonylcarbamoyl adenosine modification protein (Sua5/YciO/YrdC/YwlC family)